MATSSSGWSTMATSVRAMVGMATSPLSALPPGGEGRVRGTYAEALLYRAAVPYCQGFATGARFAVERAPMTRRLVVTGLLLAALWGAPAAPQAPDLRGEQDPANRFFWTEWGFCDLEPHGPVKARGVVIWNHGISGTNEQYNAPPALALRILQARGWDVIKINRNNLGETSRRSE